MKLAENRSGRSHAHGRRQSLCTSADEACQAHRSTLDSPPIVIGRPPDEVRHLHHQRRQPHPRSPSIASGAESISAFASSLNEGAFE